MKYRGFVIKPVYHICLRTLKCGTVVDKKPTKKDLSHYAILDPMYDMDRWICEDTKEECKETVDRFLAKVGMRSNAQSEWDKLDG